MPYSEALKIVRDYYEKSVFTLEETKAFMTVLEKCDAMKK